MYLGKNPITRLNPPAKPLRLPVALARELLPKMKADLLERPNGFRRTIKVPDFHTLELDWVGAGQTAALAIWAQEQTEANTLAAGSISLMLCGLDDQRERTDVLAALAARRLPVPPDINLRLDKDSRRPLLIHVYYNLTYYFDPILASVALLHATTFFSLLGINTESEPEQDP